MKSTSSSPIFFTSFTADSCAARSEPGATARFKRKEHIPYRERRSLMKRDAVPQLEPPRHRVDVRPLGRERGFELQVAVAANQRFVNIGVERLDEQVAAGVRIHRRR